MAGAEIQRPSVEMGIVRSRRRARWIPTRSLVLLATAPAVLALVVSFVRAAVFGVVVLDALLVALAWIDWRRTPARAVQVKRETQAVFAVGRPNGVVLHVHNASARDLVIELTDDLFEAANSEGLPIRLELAGGASTTVRYAVRPAHRGAHALADHFVRYRRRGGLITREERLEATDEVRVYPDVIALRQYDAWSRRGLERLPGSARLRGGESEFERLRPYTRDDEYRHIDWRASARRRQLTARQFQTETQQNILMAVDCGRAMRAESAGLAFLDHALNAMLMLGHVAIDRGDHVGLVAFDQGVRAFVPPGGGAATERKLIHAVYDLDTRLAEPDFTDVFAFMKTRVRKRTLVVLFTQLLEASAAARLSVLLRGLMPRHLPLCVLLRDRDIDQLTMGPITDPRELYVRGAAAEAVLWREQLVRDMRNAGVLVIDSYPDQMTPAVVKRYAEIKARQLL